MLKAIMYLFNTLKGMLNKYQEEQTKLIEDTEEILRQQQRDLMTAEKLAKKLEV